MRNNRRYRPIALKSWEHQSTREGSVNQNGVTVTATPCTMCQPRSLKWFFLLEIYANPIQFGFLASSPELLFSFLHNKLTWTSKSATGGLLCALFCWPLPLFQRFLLPWCLPPPPRPFAFSAIFPCDPSQIRQQLSRSSKPQRTSSPSEQRPVETETWRNESNAFAPFACRSCSNRSPREPRWKARGLRGTSADPLKRLKWSSASASSRASVNGYFVSDAVSKQRHSLRWTSESSWKQVAAADNVLVSSCARPCVTVTLLQF